MLMLEKELLNEDFKISSDLKTIVDAAEVYLKLFPLDCCAIICDNEGNIVGYTPAKTFDIGAQNWRALNFKKGDLYWRYSRHHDFRNSKQTA
ncbi:hypothetical protein [Fusibacter sp. 3D3]|uniref:hypothetical protein n=1 Tax=Fusibacter sp. 3D3 TaxID=1048380 RepID=UPI000852CDA5|nr:hypothetical protein [Fusibacter sp. 3D3]GAU76713.1 hypothetical protein F3D3_1310 [Fusibacter sp. 3D3]